MSPGDGHEAKCEDQEMSAKLRESFLLGISELTGEPCNITTYELSKLTATLSAWKPDGSEVLVRDLTTPAATHIDAALLRTPDLIAVQFHRPLELP